MEKTLVYSTNRTVNGNPAGVGGFADRLKGLVFCYFVALVTGRRFAIDWHGDAPLEDWFSPNVVQWRLSRDDAEKYRRNARVVDLVASKFTEEKRAAILTSESGWSEVFSDDSIVFVHTNKFAFDLIQESRLKVFENVPIHLSREAAFSWAFQRLFRYAPKAEYSEKYDSFARFRKECRFIVGLQFRTGGAGTWEDIKMDKLENAERIAEEALKLARNASERCAPRPVGVFVTSDSVVARDRIVQRVSRSARVFYYDDVPVHIQRSPAESVRSGAGQVALEHTVLSECDAIVSGKGGFGMVAAWRRNIPFRRY